MLSDWTCSLGRKSNHIVLVGWPTLPVRRVVGEVAPSSVHYDIQLRTRLP